MRLSAVEANSVGAGAGGFDWGSLVSKGVDITGQLVLGRWGTPEGVTRQTVLPGGGSTFSTRTRPGEGGGPAALVGNVALPVGDGGINMNTLLLVGGLIVVVLLVSRK